MKRFHVVAPFLLYLLIIWLPDRTVADPKTGQGTGQIVEGIYRMPADQIDLLLSLNDVPGLRMLVIDSSAPTKFSDAHTQSARAWVERGGVIWAEGEGVETMLLSQISPVVVQDYDYRKSGSGDKGGELVVRGVSSRLTISDHPLTIGVRQLYVFPERSFAGTKHALPILEMTDEHGSRGVVLAALAIGKGYIILDGTSRTQGWIFGRLPGFDEDHPNAVKQDGSWNSYDWQRLVDNARNSAALQLQTPSTLKH